MEPIYESIAAYAAEKGLVYTAAALPLVYDLLGRAADHPSSRFCSAAKHIAYRAHAMAVCHMLIDLHVPVSAEEEDILLASALCHVLPENIRMENLEEELSLKEHLHPDVCRTVRLIFWDDNNSGAGQEAFYDRIRDNKLALMIKLADRGNLVEQLYGISGWTARSYIHETRSFFFPMCIYAKEHYPDLLAPVSVLMEKMRSLTEVAEILLSRYERREADLSQEILELQEENATLRSLIQSLGA